MNNKKRRSYKTEYEETAALLADTTTANERLQSRVAQLEQNQSTALAPAPVTAINETATALAAAQAKANVEARFLVALNQRRSPDAARQVLLRDCKRPSFAQVATFSRPVGGEHRATGPSIRFAEAAARAWGNVDVDARTIYDSTQKRIVAVKVTDLESNVTYGVEITVSKTVERRRLKAGQQAISSRTNSTGQTVYLVEATEDDLLAKGNALISKAIRNGILRTLPGDLVEEAQETCFQTLRNQDAQDPDAARKKIMDAFGSIGVPVSELTDLLGHDVGACSPKEMEYLRGVFTAIKEGDAAWSDVLALARESRRDKPNGNGRTEDLKKKLEEKAGASEEGEKQEEPEAEQAPAANDQPPNCIHCGQSMNEEDSPDHFHCSDCDYWVKK